MAKFAPLHRELNAPELAAAPQSDIKESNS
jgi:hypothetical protein